MERKPCAIMIGGILLLLGCICTHSEGFQLIKDDTNDLISHINQYQSMNGTTLHRSRREDEFCDCGPHTMTCHVVKGHKICQCVGNKRFVIAGMCDDCNCGEEGICDFRQPVGSASHCKCPELSYRDEKENMCKPCTCGEQGISCSIARFNNSLIQMCVCPNMKFVIGVKCEDCTCPGNNTLCFYRRTKRPCSCPPSYRCGNCRCDDTGKCSISEYVKKCQCHDGYIKTEGDICKPCSCKPDQICVANGTETACSCNDTHYMDPNGNCAYCGCRENQTCIASNEKNSGFRCVCKENYYLSNGECKESCGNNTCVHGFCEKLPDGPIQCSCENGSAGPGCAEEAVINQASMYLIPILCVVAINLIPLLFSFQHQCI